MSRKRSAVLAVILGWAILTGAGHARAKEAGAAPKTAAHPETSDEGAAKPMSQEAYHLEFSINEIEGGKKINSRQYSMELTSIKPEEIKIGARVPVETKEGEFQYLDVGTNIEAQVRQTQGEGSILVVNAEVSSFGAPEAGQEKRDSRPIIRQLKFEGATPLPSPKTVVLASADDPTSKRQFQLEVTVTKLK